jgi:hypothetical protein
MAFCPRCRRHKWKTVILKGEKCEEVKSNTYLRRGECTKGIMPLAVPVTASDMCEDCYEAQGVQEVSAV